jgi:hypothetical protein
MSGADHPTRSQIDPGHTRDASDRARAAVVSLVLSTTSYAKYGIMLFVR